MQGSTSTADAIAGLVDRLDRGDAGRVFATAELGRVEPLAVAYAERAAGLLAIPVARVPRDYPLFFRREPARLRLDDHRTLDPARAQRRGERRFRPRRARRAVRRAAGAVGFALEAPDVAAARLAGAVLVVEDGMIIALGVEQMLPGSAPPGSTSPATSTTRWPRSTSARPTSPCATSTSARKPALPWPCG